MVMDDHMNYLASFYFLGKNLSSLKEKPAVQIDYIILRK
jgi:hypothetical protein